MASGINEMLEKCIDANGSDLHIAANCPPQIRVDGTLRPLEEYGVLSAEQAKALCYEVLSPEQRSKLGSLKELDLSFSFENRARIRGNIFHQQDSIAGAFRHITYKIPAAETLGIPEVAMKLTDKPRGLVLVTGPTGSGKSTTLAAMINAINQKRHEHIVTVEDPIEYIYQTKQCLINQREVGQDTASFPNALKYILRQDPDVVLIGEMRDLETIQSAITVAETGHLVLATLHTNTAVQTIDRIIDVFPPHHQPQVRTQLASILEGVLCQQLVPLKGGGRTLALEIMIPNSAIRNLIRENKTHQIHAQMQMGRGESQMQTLNESLAGLVNSGKIEYEEGLRRCTDLDEYVSMAGSSGSAAAAKKSSDGRKKI